MSMSRGVNGYTGFVPQSEVIPIAIKDTNERTGRVRSSTSLRGTGGLVIENAPTEMQAAFTMTPDMFPRDMSARASGALSPYNPFHDGKTSVSKPFVAESTYRQEMLAGAMKTAHVLTSGTYVGGTCRPDALGLKNPLYVSEQSQKQAEAFGIASVVPPYVPVGGYEAPSPVPTLRERQRLERDFKSIEQAASRANLDTSYRQAYGGKDFVPRSTIPMRTRKASTRERFIGTNRRAMAHSGMTDKASTKTTLLSELGQQASWGRPCTARPRCSTLHLSTGLGTQWFQTSSHTRLPLFRTMACTTPRPTTSCCGRARGARRLSSRPSRRRPSSATWS
ncbi:hypothetical protein T492DRAFT_995226, partial [Pavlovales sp. CCMP2436]